jgi:hypothetical protein
LLKTLGLRGEMGVMAAHGMAVWPLCGAGLVVLHGKGQAILVVARWGLADLVVYANAWSLWEAMFVGPNRQTRTRAAFEQP